jgi:ABC-type multidrug transport system fused ATPase/permease subunit
MKIRDLTFSYPNSQSSRPALKSVSCTLGAGQLVVIVGANGSGKTSLVKLLTRLYNPTSGSIIIDGHPSSEYHTRALRQATAVLSQDHNLFPVSITENISLGRPEYAPSRAEVEEAAKKGGAHGIISKFNDGFSTLLSPVYTKWNAELNAEHAIMKLYREIEKETEVSGSWIPLPAKCFIVSPIHRW